MDRVLIAADLIGLLPSELREVRDNRFNPEKIRELASDILTGTVTLSGVPMDDENPFEFVEV